MADKRDEKFGMLLKEIVAQFVSGISNRQSLITVTDVQVSGDGRHATFFVTVFPEDKEQGAIGFLKRNRPECKEFLKSHASLRMIPLVDFEIDKGEKARQKIDTLLS